MAAPKARLVPSYVETGQVIDVDVEHYTVSVVTQFTQKALTGLAFATPYQHFSNGEGIYCMPEVGSLVWLCFPSDGGKPFVMAWAPAREDNDSLRSNKKDLNPGDIYLGTRDDNAIVLRRGGVVQITGGPLCQRLFLPVNNTISDFCENYGLHTLGGDLEWTVDRSEFDVDGHRAAHLRLKAREYADDAEPIAYLEIGSHTTSKTTILSLTIKESGAKRSASKISLSLGKDGSMTFKLDGAVDWNIGGELKVKASGVEITSPSTKVNGSVEVTGSVEVGAGASGLFTTLDNQKVTVVKGIITLIVPA